MRFQLISLFVILNIYISPSAFAYEPSGITQCLKKDHVQLSHQSLFHKSVITTYEGEQECRAIVSGKIDRDCRSTFKRHIINKGRECGHKGSNEEVFDAYKDRANKVYGFRGGFEIESTVNRKKTKIKAGCTGFSISANVVVGAAHCFKNYKNRYSQNYNKFTKAIIKGELYFTYNNKNNIPSRVKLNIRQSKMIGSNPKDAIILFKPISKIERERFPSLPPRGTTYEEFKIILAQHKMTEIIPRVNEDWVKKFGTRGWRKLYSICPIGLIDYRGYDFPVYVHKCDSVAGSSGAPILSLTQNICNENNLEIPELLAIDIGNRPHVGNFSRPMSGKDLESIYQFIDKVK